jgi:predicted DCC family thiol-disulfide oxidoreductase YuxK
VSELVLIYDGQGELCKNSVSWVQQKLEILPLDFRSADLSRFGLSKEECSREVFVISDQYLERLLFYETLYFVF